MHKTPSYYCDKVILLSVIYIYQNCLLLQLVWSLTIESMEHDACNRFCLMVRPAWNIMLTTDFVWSNHLEMGCAQHILFSDQTSLKWDVYNRFCLVVKPAWNGMCTTDFLWWSNQLEMGCIQQILCSDQTSLKWDVYNKFCIVIEPAWNGMCTTNFV